MTTTEQIHTLRDELRDANETIDELQHQIDKVDEVVGEALRAIGRFPGPPAGFWDRIDTLIQCSQ